VEIEDLRSIDPRQTRLPEPWRSLPAYPIQAGEALKIEVIRRGDPQPEPDSLSLKRDIWLDFDGRGYTLQDKITGKMTSGWRLSVEPELILGRARLDGKPQFITRLEKTGRMGLEVRRGDIDLLAESRIEKAAKRVPASGWGEDFQRVQANLHLPPGWKLLTISGVDSEHHSWLRQWTLYDLFLVFVIAVAAGKLWGWRWSLPVLLTLTLIWHEPDAPRHVWLFLLAMTALHRVLPDGGYRKAAYLGRAAGLAVLIVITLPFMVEQARTAIFPQLALQGRGYEAIHQARAPASPPMATQDSVGSSVQLESFLAEKDDYYSFKEGAGRPKAAPKIADWQPDPEANIQTGPGLPSWSWQRIPLNWNGPVSAEQHIQLTLAGPTTNLLLNLSRILLLLLIAWRFSDWRSMGFSGPNTPIQTAILLMSLSLGLTDLSKPLQAAPQDTGFPPAEVLAQLEQRLLQPPDCLPRCAGIQRMHLLLDDQQMTAQLFVHTAIETAIPLPLDTRQQTPQQVSVDGKAGSVLARDHQGRIWLRLDPGRHRVRLSARLPALQQLQLPLPLTPQRLEVESSSWSVEGLGKNQVPEKQLHLTRVKSAIPLPDLAEERFAPQSLPPFVNVERNLRLDLEWQVETRVRRLSPIGVPVVLHIPLLADESVITDGITVKDGKALVNMSPNSAEIHWISRLPIKPKLLLRAPETVKWMEQWQVDVGPVWHAKLEGIAPVHHQGRQRWLPTWKPWPSETLAITLDRPSGVDGATRTIDRSSLTLRPGKRATDASLEFRLRSSQGGRHEIVLPPRAELLSVEIDDQLQPIRQEGERVSLPLHPGEQIFRLAWRQDQEIEPIWRTPTTDLGLDSVNSQIRTEMAHDRWVLFTRGPTLGPAVLFWGELLIILLAALILGRFRGYSPLGTVSWLLLGVGLSQVSIWAGLLVVVTFFAFGYRRGMSPPDYPRSFNLMQLVLVMLALFTLITLFLSVQQGLLGLPQMQIGGNGSSAYQLNWYQDRSSGELPVATIYSAPLWIYRLLMLAWALWLAFSLLSWMKWAWESFSRQGRWIEIKIRLPRRKKQATRSPSTSAAEPSPGRE
jgi:hypothetical protein